MQVYLLAALAVLFVASTSALAEDWTCEGLRSDCLHRGVSPAICDRNAAKAKATGYWPPFARGDLKIPARPCRR